MLCFFYIFVFVSCGLDSLLNCICRLVSICSFKEEHVWSNSFLNSSHTAVLPTKEQCCRMDSDSGGAALIPLKESFLGACFLQYDDVSDAAVSRRYLGLFTVIVFVHSDQF